MHRRTWFRKHYTRDQLNNGIMICRRCHQGIHQRHDEMTLGKHFSSLEKLLADPALAEHFAWVAKQRERL